MLMVKPFDIPSRLEIGDHLCGSIKKRHNLSGNNVVSFVGLGYFYA